jgi:2-polyprenyl-3-methyl-5-hydroxy-6-metoxy-1,4-benzoquinol methylase
VTPRAVDFFYDDIAHRFEGLDHPADVRRRLEIVFDECLAHTSLAGALTLDAGCGYGLFSAVAAGRGARVVSLDLGERLVGRARVRAGSHGVVADASELPIGDGRVDIVIASEMLEHTATPARAIAELARSVKPGGLLVLTTPNRAWQRVVRTASRLHLRPFRGRETFVHWDDLERACGAAGLDVLAHVGFHPWPFQLGLAGAARRVEARVGRRHVARWMVNQALLARKRSTESPR